MKLPRDLTGTELVKALSLLGYRITRQPGSHIRLTCESPTQHHVTVPAHDPLKVGTLSVILNDVAAHLNTSRDDIIRRLFGA